MAGGAGISSSIFKFMYNYKGKRCNKLGYNQN